MTSPRPRPPAAAFFAVLLCGLVFRFDGLGDRLPVGDESHYRANMYAMKRLYKDGAFRDHSVRHDHWQAPHGMVSQWLANVCRKSFGEVFQHLLPRHSFLRDNFKARSSHALLSLLLVLLLYAFARRLYSPDTALAVMLMAAVSPLLILWGRSEYLDTTFAFFGVLSLYLMWGCFEERRTGTLIFKAALCGGAAGLCVGTKWSALALLPLVPAAFFVLRLQERDGGTRKDVLFYLFFIAGAAILTFTFVSPESFRWALFPDPNDVYGDPAFERGITHTIRQGFASLLSPNGLPYLLWWGGIVLPLAVVAAWGRLLTGAFRRRWDGRSTLLVLLSVIGLLVFIVNGAGMGSWRACFTAAIAILLAGHALETLDEKKLGFCIIVVALTTVPLSVYYGLRLGVEPLVFGLQGMEHTVFEYLPAKE